MSIDGYNLVDEPWLLAIDLEGREIQVSLREALINAHRLRALSGDLPTQAAALQRLLIAILYRAIPLRGPEDDRLYAWKARWEAESLPAGQIEKYLDEHRSRFDLLDPVVPFMQVAILSARGTSGLPKLIADVPDGEPFFTLRSGAALKSIELDEAARWLVHCQAYDPSGIKTGANGDPRVKGGRGYPIGIGWSGWCGLVMAQGATLKETLLLNQVGSIASGPTDRPVWERAPVGPGPETEHPDPLGPADLMTWQSRRILLHIEDDRAVDAQISNGDAVHPRNRHLIEPHCAWRLSPNQSKQHGGTVYMPRGHAPARALWRGLPGLLAEYVPTKRRDSEAVEAMQSELIHWLSSLRAAGFLSETHPLALMGVGVTYGSQSSTIATIIADTLRLRTAVLAEPSIRHLAVQAVDVTDDAVGALAQLARHLADAGGTAAETARRDAFEMAYSELDAPYRRWVATLDLGVEPMERMGTWQYQVQAIVRGLGEQFVRDAGTPAWLGRPVRLHSGADPQHLDTGLAWRFFETRLRKVLPLAAPNHDVDAHPTDGQENRQHLDAGDRTGADR